jgi:hypothetical protein
MKDAKGHGSNPHGAHAEGTDQIGQSSPHSWLKYKTSTWLVPATDAKTGNVINAVGSISPTGVDYPGRQMGDPYKRAYAAHLQGENQHVLGPASSTHASSQAAKKWIVSEASRRRGPITVV